MYPFGATSTAGGVSYSLTVQSKRCSLLTQCGTTRPSRPPHRLDHLRGNYNIQVWCEILDWLQQHPDAKAAQLLDRLMARYPNRYSRRQLRTLQRRVRQWRIVVAKQLVYASAEQSEVNEADLGDITSVSDN